MKKINGTKMGLSCRVGATLLTMTLVGCDVVGPTTYRVTCINKDGRIVYQDDSMFYPTVYQRNGRVTCIVKGIN